MISGRLLATALLLVFLALGVTSSQSSAQTPPIQVGSPSTVTGTGFLSDVSCVGSMMCFAVGENAAYSNGVVVPITNGSPGTAGSVASTSFLTNIACASSTNCFALGYSFGPTNANGTVVPITNGVVGTGSQVATQVSGVITVFNGIACTSSTACLGVGQSANPGVGAVIPITSGVPGSVSTVAGTLNLQGIACPASGTCYAVGWNSLATGNSFVGVIVPITNGSPGSASTVAGTDSLWGIACSTSSACFAVGERSGVGVVVPITNGSPGSVSTVTGAGKLTGIACPTSNTCLAVTSNGSVGAVVPITNGSPGSVSTVVGTTLLARIACPSSSTCYAVGGIGTYGNSGSSGVVAPITVSTGPTTAVSYPAGWNLVGGPSGTIESGAAGALYTYQAGDSNYESSTPSTPLQAPKGYWAYFPTAATVMLPVVTAQTGQATLPANQFIMVGNPTDSTVSLSGADIVDTFTPATNSYTVTTGAATLAPGQGAWVFSHNGGTLTITPVSATPGSR